VSKKFEIEIELDGYDTIEEMYNAISKDEIYEALGDYGFTILSIKEIDNG
jgi:hypothetical protein